MKIQKRKNNRNGTISLLKFLASITIMLYHGGKIIKGSNHFPIASTGYILVDLFFIISGYYFYLSIIKIRKKNVNIYKENIKNTIQKLKMFLPYTIFIGISSHVLLYHYHKILKKDFLMSIFNILLLDMSGVNGYTVNGPTWYLSAMLIVFFIELPVIYKYREKYTHYISVLIVFFGIGYMYKSFSSLNIFLTGWNGFFYNGLVRAIVDINIGIIIYQISESIKGKIEKFDLKKIILLEIFHISLYLFVAYFVFFYQDEGSIDYFVYLIIMVALIISFSETVFSRALNKSIINYLEKISLPIFINQFFFIELVNIINRNNNLSFFNALSLYSCSTILFSVLEYYLINFIRRKKLK